MDRPEDRARERIDALLAQAGWEVSDTREANIRAARGVVIRNFSLKPGHGFADYLLYVDGKAVGVIEAKKEGTTLTGVETQSAKYSQGLPDGLPRWGNPLPFSYESTGSETRFTNGLDPEPRSRPVFAFHKPETLAAFLDNVMVPPFGKGGRGGISPRIPSPSTGEGEGGGAGASRFTPEQMKWLEMIRDHIAANLGIEPDDFEYAPFSQNGGLGKVHQLFGDKLNTIIEELNETLAA
jgi:hypothetical protein